MSQNIHAFTKQARKHPRRVYFTGTTAIKRGEGVCYDRAYGTAADNDGRRDKMVAVPTEANCRSFAGVCHGSYDAEPNGQWIEINEPGSVCDVAIGCNVVVNTGIMTCSKAAAGDTGRFQLGGIPGLGSAIPLQTVNLPIIDLATAGTLDATGKIITVGNSQNPVTAGVIVGDTVVVVAGNHADVVEGRYTVTALSATTITVGTAISTGTHTINYFVMHGNALAQALLMDGRLPVGGPSGLLDWYSNLAANLTLSATGTTLVGGGHTPAADRTATMVAGVRMGDWKLIRALGTLTTNDVLVAPLANGVVMSWTLTTFAEETFATIELDAVDEFVLAQWMIANWKLMDFAGTMA